MMDREFDSMGHFRAWAAAGHRFLVRAKGNLADGSTECWLLSSNGPPDIDAVQLARWSYYRWEIESFFKLLKTAGLEVESRKQQQGLAILKRLRLAAMALSLVYRLAQAEGEQAAASRKPLIKRSGRLMRHQVEHTVPVLLAGLRVLLQVHYAMEQWTHAELNALHDYVLGKPPPTR